MIEREQVCAGWRPILIGQEDALTDETAKQIEDHNEYGVSQKCWTAPQ